MSYAFIEDLTERKRQVRHYLLAVSAAERNLSLGSATRTQEGRLLTLRAGAFLVLYNLIEATTRGAIEAIHDEIITKNIGFTSLNPQIRKEVVIKFRKSTEVFDSSDLNNFPSGFVAIALALNDGIKIAGSVDARKIRSLGECYGFSCKTDTAKNRDGSDLLTIKTNRNDLAHGHKTYEEVGRNYTSRELMFIARRSMHYITAIVDNISDFLETESYLG